MSTVSIAAVSDADGSSRHTGRTGLMLWLTGAAVGLLIVIAVLALLVVSRELQAARTSHLEAERTRDTLAQVRRVLLSLQDAETGERGYIITGKYEFLEPYYAAERELESQLAQLDELITDEQSQALLRSLAQQARQQLELLRQAIEIRRAKGMQAAVDLVAQSIGKQNMDRARGTVQSLIAREEWLLATRRALFEERSTRSEAAVRIALYVAILLVAVAGVMLIRHTRGRLQAEAAAQEALALLRSTEAAYRDQATRLTSILDNVVDGIVTINESGSIESWSKGAERLFGYEADEVLRRNVRVLMHEPHASAHDGYLRRYVQSNEPHIIGQRIEVEARHKDGRRIPVELGISEMRLDSRRLFIGIARDISARLEIERLKAGFVSTVSHELRTPLTSISGSLGLLAGGVAGELPAKATRLIDIAKLNCERLVRLINDILDMERAEAGKLDFRLEPQRLRPIVQHAIDLNRAYAHNFGVQIELDPHAGDADVFVDRDRLIQVLTNMLSNAAKFSPRGGTIHIAIRSEADSVHISVRDEGPGIAEEFQGRIFQKFAQADSSDSRAKGGTGLGLSIAKTIIERLGGSIGFRSTPGAGATFHITLPIRHEVPVPIHAGPPLSGGPAVLICEDDPDVARILVEILRQEGMRAEVVSSARAARAALDAVRFDVALVDLHLPDADGLELITELRAREATRSLPVIVVTARSPKASDAAQVSTLQLADWLQKPIDPQRLLSAIHNSLAPLREGRARILHVEDDESLTHLVNELLCDEAEVVAAHSLAEAREHVSGSRFDLVILDITLGDGSGLDILPMLRQNGRAKPPVILYSATEPSRELSGMVQAALVKSRDSVEQLLSSVRALAGRTRKYQA